MLFKKYQILSLLAVFLAFASCQKEIVNSGNIIALGHGGMGSGDLYPMNSYESIRKCLELGMDGVEIDVQMTKDSVLVAFHDVDLSDAAAFEGKLHDLTWEEIQDVSYNAAPYLDCKIVSLEEIFEHIDGLQKCYFTLDCKLYTNDEDTLQYQKTFAEAVVRILKKYHLEENIFIESQNKIFLNFLQELNPELKLFIYPDSFEEGFDIALEMNLYGITISTEKIEKEEVEAARERGVSVAIWGVKSEKSIREAIEKNPVAIQTDDVKNLLKLLGRD